MTQILRLVDDHSTADLAVYVGRAARADPGGAARLSVTGTVLALYVSPVSGGRGPTVLGLRTFALVEQADVDVVVPLSALADRLARPGNGRDLPVPPMQPTGVAWAGVTPPRSGWLPAKPLPVDVVIRCAEDGIAEVAAGSPDVAGAPAVAALRARVWGRVIPGSNISAGTAFAAHALGFVRPGDAPAACFTAGPWTRLSTGGGHVLARQPLLAT